MHIVFHHSLKLALTFVLGGALSFACIDVEAQDQPLVSFGEPESLTIQAADKTYAFQVEIADTPLRQKQGLMYRKNLADNVGMLFIYNHPQPVFMWMKNTFISLDILFLNTHGEIVKIFHQAQPHSERLITSGGNVSAVLEIKGGRTKALGLRPGDDVLHPFFLIPQREAP